MESEDKTAEEDETFVAQASHSQVASDLPTLQSLNSLPASTSSNVFAPYTFWLSREVPRPIFEFIIRSFGGRVGWPQSSGSGSPFNESDESITHVVIDRPPVQKDETPAQRELRLQRKYVQPQWVVDSINAGKILLEDTYAQGKPLPPHLSPFGESAGAYDPTSHPEGGDDVDMSDVEQEGEDEVEVEGSDEEADIKKDNLEAALASVTEDPASLRAAELAAEAAGMDYGTFEAKVKSAKKSASKPSKASEEAEQDMNKMLMSNKQKKLYEKMKYSQQKKSAEVCNIATVFFLLLTGVTERKAGIAAACDTKSKSGQLVRFCDLVCVVFLALLYIFLYLVTTSLNTSPLGDHMTFAHHQ
jgi:pescadillo protein